MFFLSFTGFPIDLIVVSRITYKSIHLRVQYLDLFQEESHDFSEERRDELSLTMENKGGTIELTVKSTANEGDHKNVIRMQ